LARERDAAGRAFATSEKVTGLRNGRKVAEIPHPRQSWTKDARAYEKAEQQARAWDLWLDCHDVRSIETELGIPKSTIDEWLSEKRNFSESGQPPASRQHFDVWSFAVDDGRALC
jgi:hypothetical protein